MKPRTNRRVNVRVHTENVDVVQYTKTYNGWWTSFIDNW